MSWTYKIASSWPRAFCRDGPTWVQTIWHMTYDSVKAITWTEKIWLLLAINVSVRCLSFLWILDSCIISVSSAEEAAKMHIYIHLPFTRGTSGCNRAANKRCTSVALSKHRPISSTALILNYSLPKCQKQMTFCQDLPNTLARIFHYDLIAKKGHVKPLDHLR